MSGTVLVLGAKGRAGRAAVEGFAAAGWRVTAFARSQMAPDPRGNVIVVQGDAFSRADLVAAAQGADVIVHALNPQYPDWERDLPRLSENVIAAARQSRATVMIPGNVYNYGEAMPRTLSEATPHRPTSRKGRLRVTMEQSFADAANDGVRTIIVRAGDFIEAQKTGNWFDSHIANKLDKGVLTYPGPMDRVHAWAWLPDLGRVMAALAEKRADFAAFEQFGFGGFSLTGQQLRQALEIASGQPLKVKTMPWRLIRLLGWVWPQMREVAEMDYLWRTPHAIDGAKLAATLPDFRPTPLTTALQTFVAQQSPGNESRPVRSSRLAGVA
jgi:nucleoside-diphosphate-sugar epimerase